MSDKEKIKDNIKNRIKRVLASIDYLKRQDLTQPGIEYDTKFREMVTDPLNTFIFENMRNAALFYESLDLIAEKSRLGYSEASVIFYLNGGHLVVYSIDLIDKEVTVYIYHEKNMKKNVAFFSKKF